jgi:uncharacterized protein
VRRTGLVPKSDARRLTFGRLIGWCLAALLFTAAQASASGDLRLVDAARNRDATAVAALLRQGSDVNSTQPDGATSLLWAAQWDDVGIAELLLRAGAKPELANDYGVTPLSMACLNGSARMVDTLLTAGANPNVALLTGETALMTAAKTGNPAVVKALLAHGADVSTREPFKGQTALMWAAAEQHLEVVRTLLEGGADVHAVSLTGFTPLLFAAREGNVDVAKLLLSRGANVNETDKSGLSVLHVATVRGHVELAEFLLDQGANPNADGPGYTALHWAVWRAESVLTQTIPNARGEWGRLGGLPPEGKLRLVKSLVAKGADVNARATKKPPTFGNGGGAGDTYIGATPFFMAAAVADVDVMRLLVTLGADPQLTPDNKALPLIAAAGIAASTDETLVPEASRLKAAEFCIELGNDVNAANIAGNTALHTAARMGYDTVVQLLAGKGAHLSPKNKQGQTPLKNAARNASTTMLLRKLGATE